MVASDLTFIPSLLPSCANHTHPSSGQTMNSQHAKQPYNYLPREIIDNVYTWGQSQSRLLWTASALTSLLSARYLLVESNFHYPLLLFPAQLFMTTTAALLRYSWRAKVQHTGDSPPARSYLRRGSLMTMFATCFAALSMVCMLQAILHFENLPTLVMLTVSISAPTRDFYP
jgi:hypothetical protein